MLRFSTKVRVEAGLYDKAGFIQGKLVGNYDGKGPVGIQRADGTVTVIPEHAILWVQEEK